jgi:Activator of Hsp90 ATPase homolog 1-like protein
VVGCAFELNTDPAPGFDGVVRREVLEVEPLRRLAWRWRGGPIDTIVTFSLSSVGTATRLRVDQTGSRGAKAVVVSLVLGRGNRRIYGGTLPEYLDRSAGRGMGSTRADQRPGVRANMLARLAELLPRSR